MRGTVDKTTLARNFSRCAHLYDRYANIQRIAADELMKELDGSDFTNILEIGCGTGNYTRLLKEKFKDARLTAIDISRSMVERARHKLKDEDIEFIIGDAESVELDGMFDLVTSNASFQWFEDLEISIARYKDAIVESGAIAFSAFGPRTFFELSKVLGEVINKGSRLSANDFLEKKCLEAVLKQSFRKFSVRELVLKEKYATLEELLKKIKYTGARGNGVNGSSLWARDLFRRMEDAYRTMFGRIEATYEIFLCKAVR